MIDGTTLPPLRETNIAISSNLVKLSVEQVRKGVYLSEFRRLLVYKMIVYRKKKKIAVIVVKSNSELGSI